MNVKEVVPFLRVRSMARSLHFYIDGLGFTMKHKWVPDGEIRWCWLTLGGASMMLQELAKENESRLGEGVSIVFTCEDALAIYREVTSRGIEASEPQVLNHLWATTLSDPDGYRIEFESPTDVPEDTKLSEVNT
jgi:catechol 2,3-dioxygenase-like lactoylglutathione lyase family enzyme